jgi:hypothetical protein
MERVNITELLRPRGPEDAVRDLPAKMPSAVTSLSACPCEGHPQHTPGVQAGQGVPWRHGFAFRIAEVVATFSI